eukprot:PhM_4_TR442/c0_g1_i1/m.84051
MIYAGCLLALRRCSTLLYAAGADATPPPTRGSTSPRTRRLKPCPTSCRMFLSNYDAEDLAAYLEFRVQHEVTYEEAISGLLSAKIPKSLRVRLLERAVHGAEHALGLAMCERSQLLSQESPDPARLSALEARSRATCVFLTSSAPWLHRSFLRRGRAFGDDINVAVH